MIPVPIGHHRGVTLTAKIRKDVTCEACGAAFVYQAVRRATGSATSLFDLFDKSADAKATAAAEHALRQQIDDPDLVACPACGWYQSQMVSHFRRLGVRVGISMSVAVAVVCLVLGGAYLQIGFEPWTAWTAASTVALLLLAVGLALTARWRFGKDPNRVTAESELEERIASSQGTTLAQYEASLAAQAEPPAQQGGTPDEPSQGASLEFDWLYAPEDAAAVAKPQIQMRRQQTTYEALDEAERENVKGTIMAITFGATAGSILSAIILGVDATKAFGLALLTALAGGFGAVAIDTALKKQFDTWLSWVKIFSYGLPSKGAIALPRSWTCLTKGVCVLAAVPVTVVAVGYDLATRQTFALVVACEIVSLPIWWRLRKRRFGDRRGKIRRGSNPSRGK